MRAEIDALTSTPTTDALRIHRYRDGLYAADLLTAAIIELGFFSWLAGAPATAAEVRAHYGFADRPVDVMLTLFTAMGLVEARDGRFHLTAAGREHLTADSPWDLTASFAPLRARPLVRDFLAILTSDQPASVSERVSIDWARAIRTTTFAEPFIASMDARGRHLAPALARTLDLAGRSAVLDIGGGSGIYACAIAAQHRHVRATVFDRPPVDRIAVRAIAERGASLNGRVNVTAGDMFVDALPAGYDVHLFSNVLHDWGTNDVSALLAASRRALPAGGLVVIHDAFINANKSGPLPVAEYSAMLMHATRGKCYSVTEYAALLDGAGFRAGAYRDTVVDRGVMVATAV